MADKQKSSENIQARIAKLRKGVNQTLDSLDENSLKNELFSNILEHQIEKRAKDLEALVIGRTEVDPEDALNKGIQVFLNLRKKGFATYLAPLGMYWRSNQKYLQAAREAAKRKVSDFTRVYILSDYEMLFSKELQEDILADESSGIRTKIAFTGELPKGSAKDFGIWDNELLCLIQTRELDGGKLEAKSCLFSRSVSDLKEAKKWEKEILKYSYPGAAIVMELQSLSQENLVLLKTVQEAEKLAKQFCRKSYLAEGKCDWYHLSWQYLRLLGLVSSPYWHAEFYTTSLKAQLDKFPENGNVKILISGLADYATLQLVHNTLREYNNLNVEIVVLDFCRTPLELSRLYARELMSDTIDSTTVNFVIKDGRETYFKDNIFDIVITDAFLTRFPDYQREKIVSEWHRILKPGGAIITTTKVSTQKTDLPMRATQEQIDYYLDKAQTRLENNLTLFKPLQKKILEKAELYASHITSYPFPDELEVQKLFSNFAAEIKLAETPGELVEKSTYARIFGRKN